MKLKQLLFASTLILLTSCIDASKFSLDEVGEIKMKGATLSQIKLELPVDITSDFNRNIVIVAAEGEIMAGDQVIAEIYMQDKVVIPKKQSSHIAIPFIIKSKGKLGLLSLLPYAKNKDLTISGFVKARAGGISKKVKVKNYSIGNLANFVDIPDTL